MTEKNKPEQLSDEFIREALVRDFESVEPPPADKSWRRIEAGLRGNDERRQAWFTGWIRYAAIAAAALLVIVLSSVGIMQVTDFATPAVEEEAPMRAADEEMEALDVEDMEVPEEEAEDVDIAAEEEAVSELPPFETTADPSPPQWQEALNDSLFFEEAVLLSAGDRQDYHGALYYGDEEKLLWVKSKDDREETATFIEALGEHIQAESRQVEEIDGYTYFEAAGQPGLAWQEDEQNQALVVISGPVSIEELESITADLD